MTDKSSGDHHSRGLKSRHVQLIAIGGTIGTGLFLGAGQSIHLAGPSILLAYLITGIACFLLMRSLGELLLSNVDAHSFIDFIYEYLGEKVGFVAGWTYWICWVTIAMTEITAVGLYMKFWFPSLPQWIPGMVMLLILLGINLVTVGLFGETEFWFALIKIIAIVVLICIGIYMVVVNFKTSVGHASLTNLVNHGGFFPQGIKGFVLSFQMVLFSFVGIEMVGLTAAETEDPMKVIPEAINEIPLRIILFYVGSLLAIMAIYPWNMISESQSPFVQVFENIGIKSAASIINVVVITAAASACNGSLFSTGRMLFSLNYGKKNKFSKKISTLSHNQVPAFALKFSTAVIAISVILNMFMAESVFTFISSIATTCFLFIWGTIVIAHLKYRRKIKLEKAEETLAFKMPLFPMTNYLILAFLTFVGIVLCLKPDTLIALIASICWLIILYGIKSVQMKLAD
ncbi:amino acid permease [Dellaglioa algida]|uniref:APC family amino acid-polyamine-organocation transporter n=1 Tax=Dellaglioa algida DSM 15638 TaxID=1423719 RepID=A0A0R1HFI4_9LACO|nr:amino acid permease [Dellaglioa algida]KRK45142.1 APC family amino acid-polyamine-organocation transporter [Dellaglioa algida DSM 15638]MDK1719092.1 amino acid permease [Dellaglioa algida]MDK1727091.1 amino acid permease [Dellaglioa algida]MDK1730361.1 amino acid permease [Dellaglioa algida]MDK1733463.1 amino acid permease [Dellaglioa algida]